MLATLLIERIGLLSPRYGERQQWVAEIVGTHPLYHYDRRFLCGRTDYTRTRSIGRGTYKQYLLRSDAIYEVYAPISWKHHDRYFCRVMDDGTIVRLTQTEVDTWLTSNHGASQSGSTS